MVIIIFFTHVCWIKAITFFSIFVLQYNIKIMPVCPRKRFVRLGAKRSCDPFQTSYERSYYYLKPSPWSVQHVRFKTDPQYKYEKELPSEHYASSYNKDYVFKFVEDRSETYRRSSIAARPTLKNLFEKFTKDPVRPLTYSSTYGTTYVTPEKRFEPFSLPRASPTDDATCPIVTTGKEQFPTIPINEVSFSKHLDPLVSTTRMTHVNFTPEERNDVVVVKDITPKISKCHHFLPKSIPSKGPLPFPRCTSDLRPVYPNKFRVIPYKGFTSTYNAHYDYVLTNLIPWPEVARFPTVFKLSRNDIYKTPSMYRTEQCHVGTRWPIRAAIDL